MKPLGKRLLCAAGMAFALQAGAAAAQEQGEAAAPPRQPSPHGFLVTQLTVTSDYRYNGVSNSSGEPAIQGTLYWWRPDGNYAAIFATSVDLSNFGDTHTSYEVDVFAGHNWDFGPTRLTAEAMYTFFPDNETFGPTYDFLQLKGQLRRTIGAGSVTGVVTFVPQASYGSGQAWRYGLEGLYPLSSWLSLRASYGERFIQRGQDRAYWEAGFVAKRGPLEVDLRYADTNLSPAQCSFTGDGCGPTVIARLTATFMPAF